MYKNENAIYWPARRGLRKLLGDLEIAVMECVWAHPPGTRLTIRDVFEVLAATRKAVYTTTQTTMVRLADKGLLKVDRSVYPHVYWTPLDRDTFTEEVVGDLLESLLADFAGPALAKLSEVASGPEAVAGVAHLIDEIRRRRQAEGP
jgi:predicted transcriptional regulator